MERALPQRGGAFFIQRRVSKTGRRSGGASTCGGHYEEGNDMLRLGLIAAVIGGALAVAACNTVRGAAADLNSAANCTENAINTGRCK